MPTISLPKGGGAIRGMGEKFAANPVTGTGSMSVPIAASPGRSGFGPQLSLSYDSGAGNGPFGFGWRLPLPAVTRKTDKGLPRYQDAEDSDVFILSGAEDLVPVYRQDPDGTWVPGYPGFQRDADGFWVRDPSGRLVVHEDEFDGYRVRRYRPRIEGLFARIERWSKINSPGDVHWRSISNDNILTLYGHDANSRIADPLDAGRVFSWLICESRDDKGNGIRYLYKEEDGAYQPRPGQADPFKQTHQFNRGLASDRRRTAQRYLKRVLYGNRKPLLDAQGLRPRHLSDLSEPPADTADEWLFEVRFDYGELDEVNPTGQPEKPWFYRPDAFSSYRSGFEVRTCRRCERVLMLHHIPDQPGGREQEAQSGYKGVVRSTGFIYDDELDPGIATQPVYSFLKQIVQTGWKRENDSYIRRSLPPVEFEYTRPVVQDVVEVVDSPSIEHLPVGLDGAAFRWVDLHGEGIPGILTEQAGAWFYKRNLSPIPEKMPEGGEFIRANFAPLETVDLKPNVTLSSGTDFMDLAGDGQPDVVVMEGPTPGLYEHDEAEGWQPFRPFTSRLNLDTRDSNLKFVDLDGDGHADIILTEDDAFVWHASLAEDGFGPARRVAQALDEEKGPRIVFADGTQSIFLADMSGDGLTDLVRIRNSEICYWPNLGYCRFGARVTMTFEDETGHSACFDHPDQFDHKRIRLADIDGSGTTDIIYLHPDGVRLYFNQSGNGWSQPQVLKVFPRIDDLVGIVPIDLLGNGTACLVWSSPLPGDARQPMRYVNLMGGAKPHLLTKVVNNLGAETHIQYAPSTKFYLQDKRDGKPWITRLPFPVHCVERVTVTDRWRKTRFSSTYAYHHGYFDGIEREFRGFGRVEQVDVESYGKFEQGNIDSPYITPDKTLHQPPVKTITWFHTGAFSDREHILSQYRGEYFKSSAEIDLPEPDLATEDLTADEWREALRACKGMMLRREVYELDVDALELDEHRPVKLFSTAYHNCHIRRLQPKALNPHAVFLVAESEAITYHYELDLKQGTPRPDPRIAHTLNLKFDEYGNVLQSAAVVYPRIGEFEDNTLKADEITLIRNAQQERHLAYTETRYTNDVDGPLDPDNYRLRVPCEVLAYEVTGVNPEDERDGTTGAPRDNRYFTLDELRHFRLSDVYQPMAPGIEQVEALLYHQLATGGAQKRLVEHVRMLFFKDDPADPAALKAFLPFGRLGRLGLAYETYTLALTTDLLNAVFTDSAGNKLDKPVRGALSPRQLLNDAHIGGYLSGADLDKRFAPIPPTELVGQYWIRSGIAGFAPDAAQHFYLPERYEDPFGNVTTLEYDARDLFVKSSTDPMGNKTEVIDFDFRVLAPREMKDINGNLSEVFFDVLGLPTAMAVKGKGNDGDNLTGLNDELTNPDPAKLTAFFVDKKPYDEDQARDWLGNATARHVYYFGETIKDGKITWGTHPACACGILREQHVSRLAPGAQSPLQVAFEYSDGMGSIVVKKIQAEPDKVGQPMRWIANGKTILNNKGKPVKQYEPYFSSSGHRFEEPREEGVTPVIYYDAVGRTVRTEMPDGSFSRVEFSPWHVRTVDQNDTVIESKWYTDRNPPDPDQPLPRNPITGELSVTPDQRAAWLAAQHRDTPALTILDSLGREVISIAHNRVKDATGALKDEKFLTFTRLDAEGKPLWIRDARKNLVMQYITPTKPTRAADEPDPSKAENIPAGSVPCYDIAGNLLFQHSMDAGDRWMLNDAAGKPMLAWDNRGHTFRTDYDELHRPVGSFVKGADPLDPDRIIQFEKVIYGDTSENGLTDDQKKQLNLRGKPYRHYDTAGVVVSMGPNLVTGMDEAFDFKGNLLRGTRQLVKNYKGTLDWSGNPALDPEIFTSSTRYDALNRPIQIVAPHSNQSGTKLNVIRPGYNAANLLEAVDVWLEQNAEPGALLDPETANLKAVTNIDYNAKGQRTRIEYNEANHPIITEYTYDTETFRLIRLLTTRPKHSEADKRTLQDLSYTYDPVGNITDIHDAAQQTVFFDNVLVAPSNTYEYDALYRLIRAEGREHAVQNSMQRDHRRFEPVVGIPFPNSPEALQRYIEAYEYDPVGNILGLRHTGGGAERWVRWYQYALDSNRLIATRSPGEAGKQPFYADTPAYGAKYTYDSHGNMISMPHLPAMEWDFKDQLRATQRQVVNGGTGEKTYYVYDAAGQRVRKMTETQNGKPKDERLYLGGFEVYRKYNGAGNTVTLERETLHAMDDKQRIALVEMRTLPLGVYPEPRQLVRYQLGNHLGSAALELDDQAQVISYEEYHPYGTSSYEAAHSQTETPKRYRYTGKERDEETGFSYHGARYYAPWLGRWANCDPSELFDSLNLYQAMLDNPVCCFDEDGRQTKIPIKGVTGPMSEEAIINAAAKQGWKVSGFRGYDENNVPIFEHGEKMTEKEKDVSDAKDLFSFAQQDQDKVTSLEGPKDADPNYYRVERDGKSTLVHRSVWDTVYSASPSLPSDVKVYAFSDPENGADEQALEAERRYEQSRQEFESREDVRLIQTLIDKALESLFMPTLLLGAAEPSTPANQPPPSTETVPQQQNLFSQRQLYPLPQGAEPYQMLLFPMEAYSRKVHYSPYSSRLSRYGLSLDHNPPLIVHYYEGIPGGIKGFNLLPQERIRHARSPYSQFVVPSSTYSAQGGRLKPYGQRQIQLFTLPRVRTTTVRR
ncbi:insecticidal toxin complex protein, TcdB family [Desulfococcus multivorans]|nr:insecticidal toxin complex protein, TcdB family [Desulfococcus multivorans]